MSAAGRLTLGFYAAAVTMPDGREALIVEVHGPRGDEVRELWVVDPEGPGGGD